jgi:hypothetical protein
MTARGLSAWPLQRCAFSAWNQCDGQDLTRAERASLTQADQEVTKFSKYLSREDFAVIRDLIRRCC